MNGWTPMCKIWLYEPSLMFNISQVFKNDDFALISVKSKKFRKIKKPEKTLH